MQIDGYDLYRFDRDAGLGVRGGGGLVIYVRQHYNFSYIEEWSVCTPDIECMWVRLDLPNTRKTYICNWYRPLGGNLENAIEIIENKIFDLFAARMPDIMLFGDINVNVFNKNNRQTRIYISFLARTKMTQLISTPTRITHSTHMLIDHVVVNHPKLFATFGTMDPGMSDHHLVC